MNDFFKKPPLPFFDIFTTSIPVSRTHPCNFGWKLYLLYLESTKACVCASQRQPSTRRLSEIDFFNFKSLVKKVDFLKNYKSLSCFAPEGRLNPILIPHNHRPLPHGILGCFADGSPFPIFSVQKSCFWLLVFCLVLRVNVSFHRLKEPEQLNPCGFVDVGAECEASYLIALSFGPTCHSEIHRLQKG